MKKAQMSSFLHLRTYDAKHFFSKRSPYVVLILLIMRERTKKKVREKKRKIQDSHPYPST